MLENTIDLGGYDLVWRNKPDLPVANEENKKLEEALKKKKIEVETQKVILENNINKGKYIKEHFNDLCQTLSYKQQLYKSREHELEMENHAEKLIYRECSRLEQEMKAVKEEINCLITRQKQREADLAEQAEKKSKLKSTIAWDEEALLQYLEKTAQMEKDNMALLKYTSEDDSKINELGLSIERLNKEAYENKSALEDADTEVIIVQTELDRLQEEFHNAYVDRKDIISNWEKVISQIQQRNKEVNKLTENIVNFRNEEANLKHALKEQNDLLSTENSRNDALEHTILQKDNLATKLRNETRVAVEREDDLKSQLTTARNVLNNVLYQKEIAGNSLKQLKNQLLQRIERFADADNKNTDLKTSIEILSKDTFEADHYTKELDNILHGENARNMKIQKEVDNIVKDILTYGHQMYDLKAKEKITETQIKNCQAEVRILTTKIIDLDQVRTKQESEMYEIESGLEKLRRRVKKMVGETNEEERRKIEIERSSLLATLEEKKSSLNMLTEEFKLMMEKIKISVKQLDANKMLNSELTEKIKFLNFYIANSQKSLSCCIRRKQDILVRECLERFQMKRYKKILNNKNKSVASLQKSQLELEMMLKERTEELRHCDDLLEAHIRTEGEESSVMKKRFQESYEKAKKLQARYQVVLDALGISEPGESVEAEMLIKAEAEKRDLQNERDNLMMDAFKNEEELSALKNTVWLINAANEQFRQVLYPPGINSEDAELLKSTETSGQSLAIDLHTKQGELKTLEQNVKAKKEKLEQEQNFRNGLQDVLQDRVEEADSVSKELSDLNAKLQRADRSSYRLSLDVKNKDTYTGILEDIRVHLLREVRRTVSDLFFSAVEAMPDTSAKLKELYQEANLPLPSRARSSLSLRSGSLSSYRSRASSSHASPLSSARSSRPGAFSPSIVKL